jgi:polyhydroxyalkanoate synthesis regulator phasin
MSEDKKGPKEKVSDGIKQGIGVLSAFKDALEETIQEAKERGDLSTERAREVMKDALEKAQSAAEDAKGRLDFATQNEFDGLKDAVDSIKERVSALEGHLGFGQSDDEDVGGTEAEGDDP